MLQNTLPNIHMYLSACFSLSSPFVFALFTVGCIALADALHPEAPSVVAALRERGIDVWVCSGDSVAAVAAAAAAAGIEPNRIMAEVLPRQKAAVVTQLRQQQQGNILPNQQQPHPHHHQQQLHLHHHQQQPHPHHHHHHQYHQ